MGQYHYLINLDKKQVLYPHQIGNGMKLYEQISWEHSTATVLTMLLAASCKGGARGGGDFRTAHPLVGSWAGDRVAFIGDYADSKDVPGVDAALVYRQVHSACNPGENDAAQKGSGQWTNISAAVRGMMGAEFYIQYTGEGWLEIVEGEGQ